MLIVKDIGVDHDSSDNSPPVPRRSWKCDGWLQGSVAACRVSAFSRRHVSTSITWSQANPKLIEFINNILRLFVAQLLFFIRISTSILLIVNRTWYVF